MERPLECLKRYCDCCTDMCLFVEALRIPIQPVLVIEVTKVLVKAVRVQIQAVRVTVEVMKVPREAVRVL